MTSNSLGVSVAHPSVRVKGTENNYEPVQCMITTCFDKQPHMHCPFCMKTDVYHDPLILKAHYRVKHVDKGIDFAGLKILRCCDQCHIVGSIKGAKDLKGAHWHCYKCKNGFNRRDEATKHYKTHFRNPKTTFQIQISQEVNPEICLQQEPDTAAANLQFSVINRPMLPEVMQHGLPEADTTTGIGQVMLETRVDGNTVHVMEGGGRDSEDDDDMSDTANDSTVAANETVGTVTGENNTVMVIEPSRLEEASLPNSTDNSMRWLKDKVKLEAAFMELKAKNQQLSAATLRMEQRLLNQITELKGQVESQTLQIANLQRREQDLLNQLSVPLDNNMSELLDKLKCQHEELLHEQLAQIHKSYMQYCISNTATDEESERLPPDTSGIEKSEPPIFVVTVEDDGRLDCDSVEGAEQGNGHETQGGMVSSADFSKGITIITAESAEYEQRTRKRSLDEDGGDQQTKIHKVS